MESSSNNKNLTSNNENLTSNNENLNPLIKNEILSTLVSFITQLDLVFDYINNEYINKLRDFSTTLNDDITLLNFSETTYNILKQYESNLSYIIMGKHKIKSSDYNFLNNITLFNNILEFNVFQDENKNTKKTIVSYLYNLYMSCFILKFGRQTDTTEFGQNLTSFIENLQKVSQEPTNSKNKKKKHNRHSQHTNNNSHSQHTNNNNMSMNNIMNLINNPSNLNGLDNVFKSLMSNNELMNIANDLSADIQNQNIDPLTLLTSMMSGKPNNQIQNLVNNVTKKIEHKINKGEIDKSLLESQAKNILNQFQTNTTNQVNTLTTTNTTNQNNTPTTTNTTNQDNTNQDNTKQDNTKQDNTNQDNTNQDNK